MTLPCSIWKHRDCIHEERKSILESRTGNPLSPEPFVSHAKALPAKISEKGYGDENDHAIEFAKLVPRVSRPHDEGKSPGNEVAILRDEPKILELSFVLEIIEL